MLDQKLLKYPFLGMLAKPDFDLFAPLLLVTIDGRKADLGKHEEIIIKKPLYLTVPFSTITKWEYQQCTLDLEIYPVVALPCFVGCTAPTELSTPQYFSQNWKIKECIMKERRRKDEK